MTLKCGSVKSFFTAARRTVSSTPRATKRETSSPGASAATSSSVGAGGPTGAASRSG